jgi:hypothetical protein
MLHLFLLGLFGLIAALATRLNVMAPERVTTRRTDAAPATHPDVIADTGANATNAATLSPPATTPTRTNAPDVTPIDPPLDETARDRVTQALTTYCCGQYNQVQPYDEAMLILYRGRHRPTDRDNVTARWNAVKDEYNRLRPGNGTDDDLREFDDLMRRTYGPKPAA